MGFNYGDIYERLTEVVPASDVALLHGERSISWGELGRRTNRLARALLAAGLVAGDKVAHYLPNCPEYLETFIAASKARLTHVNINYRYRETELAHLLDNSDTRAVVYGREFAPLAAALIPRFPLIRTWIEAGDGAPVVAGAVGYRSVVEGGDATPLRLKRSPDDLHFVYTGGTTGLPKGVMWRHDDLWAALGGGGSPALGIPPAASLDAHLEFVSRGIYRPRIMPLNPLMHGAAMMASITALAQGGTVITVPGAHFDPEAALLAITRQRPTNITMVGDAFGRPLAEALERAPEGRYDISSVRLVVSTGAMWSAGIKQRLLRFNPQMALFDALGSSESIGYGSAMARSGDEATTARFRIGEGATVLSADLREIAPGSDEIGYIARRGPVPLGYYKDPERTARTFPVIDGVRHAVPGDLCRVLADGTIVLLGRGGAVINTGGEKVFVEEVEESLKRHADVVDALVFGVPSERWGQAVVAVVELAQGAGFDEPGLRRHVHAELANYKSPKRILRLDRVPRAPNGKADYASARAQFEAWNAGLPQL